MLIKFILSLEWQGSTGQSISHNYLLVFPHRVLCETVKDFVSKVGTASANSDPSQAEEPDSLAQKVCLTTYTMIPKY